MVTVVRVLGGWVSVLILLGSAVAGVLTTTASGKQLMASFGAVLKSLSAVFEILADVAIRIIAPILIPVLEEFATVISKVAEVVVNAVNLIRGALGLEDIDPSRKTAQAVRQSQITDLRGFANRNYTLAYGGASADVPGATLAEAKKHTSLLEKLVNVEIQRRERNSPGSTLDNSFESRVMCT